jgi:hypothetical protein
MFLQIGETFRVECRLTVVTYVTIMTRYRKMHSFYLEPSLDAGLKAIKDRDGISESEQVRRAVRQWLKSQGLKVKATAARKGAKAKR